MNIHETLDRIAPESEAVDLSDLATYARGYTDAESKYRKMIADGELVEVVRCRDCANYIKHDKRCAVWNHGGIVHYGFCFLGERRTECVTARTSGRKRG